MDTKYQLIKFRRRHVLNIEKAICSWSLVCNRCGILLSSGSDVASHLMLNVFNTELIKNICRCSDPINPHLQRMYVYDTEHHNEFININVFKHLYNFNMLERPTVCNCVDSKDDFTTVYYKPDLASVCAICGNWYYYGYRIPRNHSELRLDFIKILDQYLKGEK